jgi:dTDP-glucose pyrophosphorylase
VHQVAEKERISDFASTGWYYFKSSYQFLNLANTLIANKEKTKGEYYIMPLYKKYLENKLKIKAAIADAMQDLGTPQAKDAFENSNPN